MKKKPWFWLMAGGLALIGLTACTPVVAPADVEPAPPSPISSPTVPFTPEVPTQMPDEGTPPSPAAYDPALQPLVTQAVDDLAARLALDAGQIEVVEAKAVVWPDSSLGCPQPGMAYKQVPQDGALIVLRAGGRLYEYHTGGSRGLFLCERTIKVKETLPKLDPFVSPPPDSADD